ncbi:MAG: chemotaxis protein CheW [Symploca sp. SIO2E9]|nr:chemotaxis protein CheW [Symploca sp. SIO2E9]
MSMFSSVSFRASSTRQSKAAQQLIVFHLCNQDFALPIRAAQKVIPMGEIYGTPQGSGLGLILYQNQELLVIDAENRIFRRVPSQDLSASASSYRERWHQHGEEGQSMVVSGDVDLVSSGSLDSSTGVEISGDFPDVSQPALSPYAPKQNQDAKVKRYILIVRNSQGKLAGLPLNSPPFLLRVPVSAFAPLTSDYIYEGNIRCVSALVRQENEQPPLFLLNPDQLIPSQKALPTNVS